MTPFQVNQIWRRVEQLFHQCMTLESIAETINHEFDTDYDADDIDDMLNN